MNDGKVPAMSQILIFFNKRKLYQNNSFKQGFRIASIKNTLWRKPMCYCNTVNECINDYGAYRLHPKRTMRAQRAETKRGRC